MENPGDGLICSQIVMGVFALYVVVVSLLRIMAEREHSRLTAMKRIWGRSVGLVMHFVANVALPMVCGVVFLSSGIAGFGGNDELRRHDPVLHKYLQRHSSAAAEQPAELPPLVHPVDLDPSFRIAP
ncbi:hypothetical protein DESUT3_18180 [Desulfuromonas versatilis]|uniref:RDD domain-containing protein n=1 Tax=Desulfuromonas versatilis TaxID=2802975 RepID=A0ABN6DZ20_9BACT|nr:hypothetical protein [Desulfuromonas versatilis]BCR04749.1 hypothetical protein DESUT3_18180 [Desulfuromonas versatilis]